LFYFYDQTDYALSGIDLNSTSTDRNQALTLTLTDTLRSISLERLRGSFDETESVVGMQTESGETGNNPSEGNHEQADFIRLLLAEQENEEEEDEVRCFFVLWFCCGCGVVLFVFMFFSLIYPCRSETDIISFWCG